MSAHELLEEPPQGHVRSELAGGTYNEMIKARPAGVPALLRSLHKQKSPQRQVLAIELMTVIQNDVIRDNAIPSQWNALLEAGLHHLYVEILMTDEIYHTTIKPHSYLIGIVWDLHGMLVQVAVDNVDITRWDRR